MAKKTELAWGNIADSAHFKELVRRKRNFVVPATVFFFVFYFMLPILAGFTSVLDGKAIGALSWAYVFAFAQFAMTWILCHMYLGRANGWDDFVRKVKEELKGKGVDAA